MRLVDIHCHMLYGVDDGARDENVMHQMIDAAYTSGVRVICMTPHYNPEYFRVTTDIAVRHFKKAKDYVGEKYPDLKLVLGQEIYYHHDSVEDLLNGRSLTLNGTRNVLLEFGPYDDKKSIFAGVGKILTSGFTPVIAHIERYASIRGDKKAVKELRAMGTYIQVNAATVIGERGFASKHFVMSLIKEKLVDIIADDCHDTEEKAPCLGKAYNVIIKKFGAEEAEYLFNKCPLGMLRREKQN